MEEKNPWVKESGNPLEVEKRQENGFSPEHLEIQPSKHLDFNTLRAVLNV